MGNKGFFSQNRNLLIGIGVLIFAVFIVFPGLIQSIGAQVAGQVVSCEDAPYAVNCVCQDRKVEVPWLGVPRFSCETPNNLLIDPDSPTFEADAVSFAVGYLGNSCGTVCTDLQCGGQCEPGENNPLFPEDRCINATFGYGVDGVRRVNVECVWIQEFQDIGGVMKPKTGTIPWRLEFLVESETDVIQVKEIDLSANYCYTDGADSYCASQELCDARGVTTVECVGTLPIDLVPTGNPLSTIGVSTSNYPSGLPR